MGYKTTLFAASVSYNFGVWVALWSSVVLVVRIGEVYGVTTYTGNLSSDFWILDFFFLSTYTGWSKNLFPNELTKSYLSLSMRLHLFRQFKVLNKH